MTQKVPEGRGVKEAKGEKVQSERQKKSKKVKNAQTLTISPARFCAELNVQLMGKKSSLLAVARSKSMVADLSAEITDTFQTRKPRLYV